MNRLLRIGSMFLDHFIMSFIIGIPMMFITALSRLSSAYQPFERTPIEVVAFWIGIFIYFNKDFVKGRSIAKRICGLVVIDIKTDKPASSLQCFIRNMTVPLWPLEFLVSLFSPRRRIGDLIANTRLEKVEQSTFKYTIADLKSLPLTNGYILIIILGVAYCYGLKMLMDYMLVS